MDKYNSLKIKHVETLQKLTALAHQSKDDKIIKESDEIFKNELMKLEKQLEKDLKEIKKIKNETKFQKND